MHHLHPPPEDNLQHDDAPPVDADHKGVFAPDELGRLQEMFEAARQACRIFGDDGSSEALGRAVIRLYKNGVRKPTVAASMLVRAFGKPTAVAIP